MTKTIDALLEALEAVLKTLWGAEPATTDDGCYTNDPLEKKVRAALAQARAEQAEPVAWMVECVDYRRFIFRLPMPAIKDGEKLTPLYTTPPAAPVAKLEPLSPVEIDDLAEYHGLDCMVYEPFVRAIEAAHNAKLGNK